MNSTYLGMIKYVMNNRPNEEMVFSDIFAVESRNDAIKFLVNSFNDTFNNKFFTIVKTEAKYIGAGHMASTSLL